MKNSRLKEIKRCLKSYTWLKDGTGINLNEGYIAYPFYCPNKSLDA